MLSLAKALIPLMALAVLPTLAAEAPTKGAAKGDSVSLQILSRTPAYGGMVPPGAKGPYEVITAIAHGMLDPANPKNAAIVDLKNAPRNADGLVAYSTDVVILRPQHASDASRVLFYDVVNRGNKLALPFFIGSAPLTGKQAPPASFPSLLARNVTVVWSGWQGGVPLTGKPTLAGKAPLGVQWPVARHKDGSPITGMSREEYIADYAGGKTDLIALNYPPADSNDTKSVTFTARQSWLTSYGSKAPGIESYDATSAPVTQWHYVKQADGSMSVSFTPPASVPGPSGKPVPADAGTIYSFVYRAKDPTVNGIGFAAVRDLVTFLRYSKTVTNPVADLAAGACVKQPCDKAGSNFDVALGEGISQSGRFIKDFLYQGFNTDAQGRRVFDGMMPIISGSRRTWTNERFSQPGRWSKEHEDHWQQGDQFPFAYNDLKDPVSGRKDGLLAQCSANHTCPKIMHIDGGFEWWGARAALVVTDGADHDLTLPDNVRYYLVPGTRHAGGPGVTTGTYLLPPVGSLCVLPETPVAETPVERALIPALIQWVALGKAPPPSQYPTIASGTLGPATRAGIGFPDLSDVMIPNGPKAEPIKLHLPNIGLPNQLFVTRYVHALPVIDTREAYQPLAPKVDANGNALAGVLMPDVSVPLATYTGWNLRGAGHAANEGCEASGSAIPLAISTAAKAGGHDSRSTLAQLYKGRADYQQKVAAAADKLVKEGYLLRQDADAIFKAHAKLVSHSLIPAP